MNALYRRRPLGLLIVLIFANALWPANTDTSRTKATAYAVQSARPKLIHDAYVFSTADKEIAVVRTVTEFVNDLLQFRYAGEVYVAQYELIIDFLDQNGTRVDGVIQKDRIAVSDFKDTNSKKLVSRYQVDFRLSPGTYQLYVEITDAATRRRLVQQNEIVVPDFSDSLSISDIAILEEIEFDAAMLPTKLDLIRSHDKTTADFVAYLEIYTAISDSVRMDYRIYDQAGYRLITFSEFVKPNHGVIRKLVPLKELIAFPGQYLIVVEGRAAGRKVAGRKSFRLQYWDPPASLTNHERYASDVLALKHVSDSKKFSEILEAEPSDRERLVDAFWAERDPTPETHYNELRNEFMSRVNYALRNYSNLAMNQHGPDTDRGKVYIRYGPPADISYRTLASSNRRYEMWYYREIDKRFIFVDKSGFGSYKLLRKD